MIKEFSLLLPLSHFLLPVKQPQQPTALRQVAPQAQPLAEQALQAAQQQPQHQMKLLTQLK